MGSPAGPPGPCLPFFHGTLCNVPHREVPSPIHPPPVTPTTPSQPTHPHHALHASILPIPSAPPSTPAPFPAANNPLTLSRVPVPPPPPSHPLVLVRPLTFPHSSLFPAPHHSWARTFMRGNGCNTVSQRVSQSREPVKRHAMVCYLMWQDRSACRGRWMVNRWNAIPRIPECRSLHHAWVHRPQFKAAAMHALARGD